MHARNAWLKGLSPKENREIPPLRYEFAYQLKKDFPDLVIAVNGGIKTRAEIDAHLLHVDGVMIGREAYHNPYALTTWEHTPDFAAPSREEVEARMVAYMQQQAEKGVNWYSIARHMLGLRHGLPGARKWRQVWSDHRLKEHSPQEVSALALGRVA